MDVIGSFMTRDVSTESVTFVEEWKTSQWEVVTEGPGRVDFHSWQFKGPLSSGMLCALG